MTLFFGFFKSSSVAATLKSPQIMIGFFFGLASCVSDGCDSFTSPP
nr:MAG TPA: hypothetical protein [Caudoviricetes sp.]